MARPERTVESLRLLQDWSKWLISLETVVCISLWPKLTGPPAPGTPGPSGLMYAGWMMFWASIIIATILLLCISIFVRRVEEAIIMQRSRLKIVLTFLIACSAAIALKDPGVRKAASAQSPNVSTLRSLQANTLCAKTERVIFACVLRRPAKIVSVCASEDLTRETGYLQYRFGLPAKVELEYPQDRTGSQQKFEHTHYFRAQVDLTEINFSVDGVEYSVVDDYNGEEKPPQSLEGLTINWPGTEKKEVRYTCRTKPKTDYTDLQAVLGEGD